MTTLDDNTYNAQDEHKQGAVQRALDALPAHVRTDDVADDLADVYEAVADLRGAVYEAAREADKGVPPHLVGNAIRQVMDGAQQA